MRPLPSTQPPERRGFDGGENRRAGGNRQLFGGSADDFGDEPLAARFEHHAFAAVRFEEFRDCAFEQVAGADRFRVLFEEDDVSRRKFEERLLAGFTVRNDKLAAAPRVVEEAVFLCGSVQAQQVEVAFRVARHSGAGELAG